MRPTPQARAVQAESATRDTTGAGRGTFRDYEQLLRRAIGAFTGVLAASSVALLGANAARAASWPSARSS